MASDKNSVMYVAIYDNVDLAKSDLDAIEQLHKDELVGTFDAAVVDKKDGKPHIVKRVDRPMVRVIPEGFDFGALPRKELKEAAADLTAGEAALFLVGEPTVDKAFDKAVTHAAKTVRHSVDVTIDELAKELKEAAGS